MKTKRIAYNLAFFANWILSDVLDGDWRTAPLQEDVARLELELLEWQARATFWKRYAKNFWTRRNRLRAMAESADACNANMAMELERLRKDNFDIREKASDAKNVAAHWQAQWQRLADDRAESCEAIEEALKFNADRKSWEVEGSGHMQGVSVASYDNGTRARKALGQ